MKTPYQNGLLCAVMQGFGRLTMFTGFDSQAFVIEPMLHSVASRHPELLHQHAGYYGQALVYFFYTIANVFAPWVMMKIGSRLTLFYGSVLFTTYFASFFYVHNIVFYTASCLLGIGFALFYMGEGSYLTEHSNKKTVERNYAIVWSIGSFCSVVGGIVMFFTISSPSSPAASDNSTQLITNLSSPVHVEQDFTRTQIRNMFGAFAAISFLSNVIFYLLPKKVDPRSLAGTSPDVSSFTTQLKNIATALRDPRMLQLIPFFSLVGSQGSLWMGVFPTTLVFSATLSRYTYLPALYSIVVGIAEIFMGILISLCSRKIENFCQRPAMLIGLISFLGALVLIVLSTPPNAITRRGEYNPDLPIQSSVAIVMVISVLLGITDSTTNNVRTVVCANVFPEQRAQAFSIGKLLQSLTSCVLYFLTSAMTIPVFTGILAAQTIISLILFLRVIAQVNASNAHPQQQQQQQQPNDISLPAPEKKYSTFNHSFRSIIGPIDDEKLPEPEEFPDDWMIDEDDDSFKYQRMAESQPKRRSTGGQTTNNSAL